tara:strand:- start:548 stop:1045 length:498 start_codon:yes stop_codon:yes gene_type:complete
MGEINLYAGDVPYVYFKVNNVDLYIPFKHTIEFFTKSIDHTHWTFENLDPDEFTPEMTFVRDWEFIIALDRAYKHGTMLCSLNETIHGDCFSVHTNKNYHNFLGHAHVSMKIIENQKILLDSAEKMFEELRQHYPERFIIQTNKVIRPEGRICQYTMNCLKYNHA